MLLLRHFLVFALLPPHGTRFWFIVESAPSLPRAVFDFTYLLCFSSIHVVVFFR